MALQLYILPCRHNPRHDLHPPPHERPLRIQIEGPKVSVERLLPHTSWHLRLGSSPFPQPAGPELARLAYQQLYQRDVDPEVPRDLVVRDEYLGWVVKDKIPLEEIDYYGVTFDHLVPADDPDPDVLQINIFEIEADDGVWAKEHLPFPVDPADFVGKKVLAIPRCCQKRKGTQDRGRVNDGVELREGRLTHDERAARQRAPKFKAKRNEAPVPRGSKVPQLGLG